MKTLRRLSILVLPASIACGAGTSSSEAECPEGKENGSDFPSSNTPEGKRVEEHSEASNKRRKGLTGAAVASKVVGVVSVIGGPPMLVAGATTGTQPAVAAGATMVTAGVGLIAAGFLLEIQARKAREDQIAQELRAYRIFRTYCQDLVALGAGGTAPSGFAITSATHTECWEYGYPLSLPLSDGSGGQSAAAGGGRTGVGGSPGSGGGTTLVNGAGGGSGGEPVKGTGGAPAKGSGGGM